ncbi:hypothetical protein B0A48_04397 [Cryoendolithus antarcticus]|uniref:Uncharacterized protein n=1 Tax=Cryoendolithus antarcticus TaxID=1507870 RepID=A0A1V8TFM1_9PEZI|nr:hypothetical protein B0A48_04397 [Cryoendolithus antarcticus]
MSGRGLYGLPVGSAAPRPPLEADIATRCKALQVDVAPTYLATLLQELKETVIALAKPVPGVVLKDWSLISETCFALLEKRNLHPLDRAQVHLYLAGMFLDEDLAVQEDHLIEADDLLSWFEDEAAIAECGETVGQYCRSLRRRHTKFSRDIEARLLWMDECDRNFDQADGVDHYESDEGDEIDEDEDDFDEDDEDDEDDESDETAVVEQETAVVEQETAVVEQETATVEEETAVVEQETATVEEETATVEEETAAAEKQTATVEEETAAVKTAAFEEETAALKTGEETVAPKTGEQAVALKTGEQALAFAKIEDGENVGVTDDPGEGMLAAISDLDVQETAADGELAAGQQHAASDSHSDHASGKLPARSIRKYGSRSMILRGANDSFAERNTSKHLKKKAPKRGDIRTMAWMETKHDE